MNFIPETPRQSLDVPYYEDATSQDGWQGQATTKSIERLKAEISEVVLRLGGVVIGFQRGQFQTGKVMREGFRLTYIVETPNQAYTTGRVDIAALPVKDDWARHNTLEKRKDQSLRMALYMFRNALEGTWFLQQLSPGYAALMPWMLVGENKTVTDLWSEGSALGSLLPPGESEFVEGKYKEGV